MAAAKRFRPPKLQLTVDRSISKNTIIELESPQQTFADEEDDDDDDDLDQFSSPNSSASNSPMMQGEESEELIKEMQVLEQLRKSVKQNLRLRPIRSSNNLKDLAKSPSKSPFQNSWDDEPDSASSTKSSYFTPTDTPSSARYTGNMGAGLPRETRPVYVHRLADRLKSRKRPLLIDTRPPAAHIAFHIQHSINIQIPSLIVKRSRKAGGGFTSLDALKQFITTEEAKEAWDELVAPGGPWDGDVIVYDEEMDLGDKDSLKSAAWALLPVIAPLLSYGNADYLKGGLAAARREPTLNEYILSGGEFEFGASPIEDSDMPDTGTGSKKSTGGLFQLDTAAAFRSKIFPDFERTPSPVRSPHSPLPMMPASSGYRKLDVSDHSPSPPPSQTGFRRPPPPTRRPSAPNLKRIDTSSTEKLNGQPKLHLRTQRSATLSVPGVPAILLSHGPSSPSHLNLTYSTHSPTSSDFRTPYFTPPHTPRPADLPPSPTTARPGSSAFPPSPYGTRNNDKNSIDSPPSSESPFPTFTISAILPAFLYLGPELTTPEHVKELQGLGVTRILNLAAECSADDHGLQLGDPKVFDRYYKIAMRDTVEEENIARGVREVCDILDDARLHSAPTYVHCKAGKSRSVTAVMAYLIHANHWTLSTAYAFVLERRKGISPNIGFVSELMNFEEAELGGKSIGVQPNSSSSNSEEHQQHHQHQQHQHSYSVAAGGNRRGAHIRESLPPAFPSDDGRSIGLGAPMSAGTVGTRVGLGDSGQEMEIRDNEGRYRHARRAPVNEVSLQPMRRVSKAGLESSAYNPY